jgi:hypothetical protein
MRINGCINIQFYCDTKVWIKLMFTDPVLAMAAILPLVERKHLKTLNQENRKILVLALDVFNINDGLPRDEIKRSSVLRAFNLLERRLKNSKIKESCCLKTCVFSIFKRIANRYNWRISSSSLLEKIQQNLKQLAEVKAKLESHQEKSIRKIGKIYGDLSKAKIIVFGNASSKESLILLRTKVFNYIHNNFYQKNLSKSVILIEHWKPDFYKLKPHEAVRTIRKKFIKIKPSHFYNESIRVAEYGEKSISKTRSLRKGKTKIIREGSLKRIIFSAMKESIDGRRAYIIVEMGGMQNGFTKCDFRKFFKDEEVALIMPKATTQKESDTKSSLEGGSTPHHSSSLKDSSSDQIWFGPGMIPIE